MHILRAQGKRCACRIRFSFVRRPGSFSAMSSPESVFVTGSDRGLGLALVEEFVRRGFNVFAGSRRMGEPLRQLASRHNGRIEIILQDVADSASIRASFADVAKRGGGLDILVNNAALCPQETLKSIDELDFSDGHLEALMNVNAFGPLRVAQAFLPLLERGHRKRIVNITSEAGSITDSGRAGWYSYCMSKAALNMQSNILQRDLQPRGFKVLAIHPGWVQTDMGGEGAQVPAADSARAIADLAMREWADDAPVYIDTDGNTLRW
jgi:NAD(P)-dependent dehydrogenase (short-subunit alcohol dehydrogenase family)